MDTRSMLASLVVERERLDRAITALQEIGGGTHVDGRKNPKNGRRVRRTMSAASRKRISEMMKKSWAERKRKRSS